MAQYSFTNYTVYGDKATIAVCSVIIILLLTSYVSRKRSLRMYMNIIASIMFAAVVNIICHVVYNGGNPSLYWLVYVLRSLYQALLFDVFFLFALYTTEITRMEHSKARIAVIIATVFFLGIVILDVVLTALGVGFRIEPNGRVVSRTNLFMIGYAVFVVFQIFLMCSVRNLIYKRVLYSFLGTVAISLLIQTEQFLLKQSTLTTLTFAFPAIAMLYIVHSNPYNVTIGAVDARALEDTVRTMYARERQFLYLGFFLPEYEAEGKELPQEVRAVVRKLAWNYFRSAVLFQIDHGQMVLLAPKRRNRDYEKRIQKLLAAFDKQYQRYQIPYKIVIGESVEEVSRKNEYASLIRSVQRELPENTVYRIVPDDIFRYDRNEYILRELADIHNKRDLNDPRVLAYCQPVFNLRTRQFDTAEALMRLQLDRTGIVTPDQFISPAEKHGYIHTLTEIILHKTCTEIKRLTEDGFQIRRISVNVSVLELKEESFCEDVRRIIRDSGIPEEKIAIELTESRSDADFLVMKAKIEELRSEGIRFYLDDFGTGYSNMERIMELPFDIIKFDRSLVIASGTGERLERIVENLAHMFRDMDYSVLYEGVEDDVDEERCREMSASYLQGYKYSRPVPIERLRDFLQKPERP